jgi:hypothetical protein
MKSMENPLKKADFRAIFSLLCLTIFSLPLPVWTTFFACCLIHTFQRIFPIFKEIFLLNILLAMKKEDCNGMFVSINDLPKITFYVHSNKTRNYFNH